MFLLVLITLTITPRAVQASDYTLAVGNTITAKVNKKSYTCKLTVKNRTLSVNKKSLKMKVGETKKIIITLTSKNKSITCNTIIYLKQVPMTTIGTCYNSENLPLIKSKLIRSLTTVLSSYTHSSSNGILKFLAKE